MTRSCLTTHPIFSFLFLLSTTGVKDYWCNAFLPGSAITIRQHYRTFFLTSKSEESLLQQKLREHFERLSSDEAGSRAPSNEIEKYMVGEKFMEEDFSWQDYVRTARIDATLENGCLYRPTLVDDLYSKVQYALNRHSPTGIMVKGPQGIGKSHTLINLVRKLLYGSDGKYLVTFIPDCSFFLNEKSLLRIICSSFGSTPKEAMWGNFSEPEGFLEIIAEINSILKQMDKQWIFIFDQINKIFARPEFEKVNDITTISFPFNMIRLALKRGRITSIISASTNNEIAYKDSHEGFVEYNHPISMDWNELQMLYPSLAEKDEESIMEVTGGVPLQVSNLIDFDFDVGQYEDNERKSILASLQKLRDDFKQKGQQLRFEDVKKSSIACVFGIAGNAINYDRKHSVPRQGKSGYYDPVYPLVSTVYQQFFWDDIMVSLKEREQTFLRPCIDPTTTNDVRGRLFEAIVIIRCIGGDLTLVPLERVDDQSLTQAEFPGLMPCQILRARICHHSKRFARTACTYPKTPIFRPLTSYGRWVTSHGLSRCMLLRRKLACYQN